MGDCDHRVLTVPGTTTGRNVKGAMTMKRLMLVWVMI